jgi:hypothetical protein
MVYNAGAAFAGLIAFCFLLGIVLVFLCLLLSRFEKLRFLESVGRVLAVAVGAFVAFICAALWLGQP